MRPGTLSFSLIASPAPLLKSIIRHFLFLIRTGRSDAPNGEPCIKNNSTMTLMMTTTMMTMMIITTIIKIKVVINYTMEGRCRFEADFSFVV